MYLCKWKNLSYQDATWEPLSKLTAYDEKIKDFERFNRSLDASQRQKMQGFSYANK
jgi:chromodomain-helicase-DNA-binding protein 7